MITGDLVLLNYEIIPFSKDSIRPILDKMQLRIEKTKPDGVFVKITRKTTFKFNI